MRTRSVITVILLFLVVVPASAQLAVIDPANLQQTVLIAQRTQRHLEELQAQYRTILRMSRGLGDLDRYRTPPIAGALHNPQRWSHGAAWLQGLNSGDPTGTAYGATTVRLDPVIAFPSNMYVCGTAHIREPDCEHGRRRLCGDDGGPPDRRHQAIQRPTPRCS